MVFVRKVRTGSGATAVQIAERAGGRDRVLEHVGSARTAQELTALLAVARRKIRPGQGELDLSGGSVPAGQAVITSRRVAQAQQDFDATRFSSLLASTAFVSGIGLDGRSKVPIADQGQVFASVLSALQRTPRVASIHSSGASGSVLGALERTPIKGAVLHWWRGNEAETLRAIELDCWFSINAAGMKHPADVSLIPLERILTETDHPSGDRTSTSPRQPGSVDDVEQALARIDSVDVHAVRGPVWTNLARLVGETSVGDLLPTAVRRMIAFARENGASR